MPNKAGILLINLGTPSAPTIKAVRRFLKEFLLDPYVITLPSFIRYILVYGFILPFRPKQSTAAYQQIWTDKGSPLLLNSEALRNSLADKLGDNYSVALGMRYGSPSIASAVEQLESQGCKKIIVLPLFPQFSGATTQSVIEKTSTLVKKSSEKMTFTLINDFYNHPAYINAYANNIKKNLDKSTPDFILFSYHGLPKQAPSANSYRTQCALTTDLLAKKIGLQANQYAMTFQSRLGRAKWIGPYTIQYLQILRKRHIENLSVVCPSFVADCLETLEEINIRLRKDWIKLGGTAFELIPCLNADEMWVDGLANWLSKILPDQP